MFVASVEAVVVEVASPATTSAQISPSREHDSPAEYAGDPPAAAASAVGAAERPGQTGGLFAGAAVPTATGLRSIHIEIPQHGQPFVFTKVLNTGGKPLDIKMSVMNATVFSAMRSGLQVAAFPLGLLLILRQRHSRNSMIITLERPWPSGPSPRCC